MLDGFTREQKIMGAVALGWIALLAIESRFHKPTPGPRGAGLDEHLTGRPRAATQAALMLEKDPAVLHELAGHLGAAGYPQAAATTSAQAHSLEGQI